jgi:tRNA U34 5-methylaminomethyl-2-thiouridine-forming methyltransferase MnmC
MTQHEAQHRPNRTSTEWDFAPAALGFEMRPDPMTAPSDEASAGDAADLSWRNDCLPVSNRFDDAYFAYVDGRAETAEVFVGGNRLPARWQAGGGERIAELGFGTGLNFFETLRTWQANQATIPPDLRLSFASFERFPLMADDMAQAVARWPEIARLAAPILTDWARRDPAADAFEARGEDWDLRVVFGDANAQVAAWPGVADAWFLDGFSPAKNPEMWNAELMRIVASRTAAAGTFSTYTAAGFVRRGLAAAGFEVEKVRGFGGKRERLQGQLRDA